MALLNYQKKEVNAKIVYYGPGLSGKTTNIQFIYKKLKPEHRGKLMTLATQTDRTLFFDFLPVELGEIKGLKTRFQLYTVPGQVFYNATRKLVLKNVDGVVFVADSQRKALNDNLLSFKNLEDNLKFYGKNLKDIPHIIQYNKRDMPDVMTVAELDAKLNKYKTPVFEGIAHNGVGVLQVLTNISKMVLHKLRSSDEFMAAEMEKEKEKSKLSAVATLAQAQAPAVEVPKPAPEPEIEVEVEQEDEPAPAPGVEEPPQELEIEVEEPETPSAPSGDWEIKEEAPPPPLPKRAPEPAARKLEPALRIPVPAPRAPEPPPLELLKVVEVKEAVVADPSTIRLRLVLSDSSKKARYSLDIAMRVGALTELAKPK
jgi:signal recognition particle receptor subunit beta